MQKNAKISKKYKNTQKFLGYLCLGIYQKSIFLIPIILKILSGYQTFIKII